MKEIHIFSKFASSTKSRMNGLATVINSQIGELQATFPDVNANTFVPDSPGSASVTAFVVLSSIRGRFDGMASKSLT